MFFKKNNSFIKKYFLKEIYFLFIVLFVFNFSTIGTLPVLDRDEARFAQSSRQMIETNNYSTIKFQEEYRSKKPIGIYWMQSFFVKNTSKVVKIDNLRNKINNDAIWKYRMISALSSLASIIILYYVTNTLLSRNIALFASLILSSSFLFVTESHIAKTDSALLTCSISVMLIMAGYYLRHFDKKNFIPFFLLWSFLALSILIKGPILLIMCIVSSVFIIVFKKDINWLKNTSPLKGIILLLIIILPNFYLLMSSGQENFIQESIKNDFLNKILSVQEKHSAFFGAHLLSSWLLFFPMSIFLIPTFLFMKKNISNKKVFFFTSWILPNLLILELIPTKLPHYTLPLYPALSILVAMMLFDEVNRERILKSKLSLLGYLFFLISSSAAIVALGFGVYILGSINIKITILTIVLFTLNALSIYFLYKKNTSTLFIYQIFVSAILYLSIFLVFLPNMKQIWVSKRITESLNLDYKSIDSRYIFTLGYNEPSLIFEIGTNLKVLKKLDKTVLKSNNLKYLILEQKYYENFIEIVQNNDIKYILIDKIKGFNSAKSIPVEINIFKIFN